MDNLKPEACDIPNNLDWMQYNPHKWPQNNGLTPQNFIGIPQKMTKEEFLIQYVLKRANTVPSELHGREEVRTAKGVWNLIQESVSKENE